MSVRSLQIVGYLFAGAYCFGLATERMALVWCAWAAMFFPPEAIAFMTPGKTTLSGKVWAAGRKYPGPTFVAVFALLTWLLAHWLFGAAWSLGVTALVGGITVLTGTTLYVVLRVCNGR